MKRITLYFLLSSILMLAVAPISLANEVSNLKTYWHVGLDTIPLGVYTSITKEKEPNFLVGIALNLLVFPGIGCRKYFKIADKFFTYGELGTISLVVINLAEYIPLIYQLVIPYLGLGSIYTSKEGLEVGIGINIYPGADESGNFAIQILPNFILAYRF